MVLVPKKKTKLLNLYKLVGGFVHLLQDGKFIIIPNIVLFTLRIYNFSSVSSLKPEPPKGTSAATRELDDLMASLSEFKVCITVRTVYTYL